LIRGAAELAEEIFDMPVKLGIPKGFSGLIDLARSPIHATGVGLILYALSGDYEQLDGYFITSKPSFWKMLVDRLRSYISPKKLK